MTGERVIIFESTVTWMDSLIEILQSGGYSPLQATTTGECILLAQVNSPDLIIACLPPDSPSSFASQLQEITHLGLPIILIVNSKTTPIPVEYLRLGVKDFFVWPGSQEDLAEVISQVVNVAALVDDEEANAFQKTVLPQKIAQSINTALDRDTALNRISEAAVVLTGAEEGYVLIYDERANQLRLRSAQNMGETCAQNFDLPVTDSAAETVVQTGEPIRLGDGGTERFKIRTGYLVKSLINVPIKTNDRFVGVLGVNNCLSSTPFNSNQLQQLTKLADFAVTALDNIQKYTSLRKKMAYFVKEWDTIQALSDQLNITTDFEIGAQLALSYILKMTDAQAGVLVWLPNGESNGQPRYVFQGTLRLGWRNIETNRWDNVDNLDGWWDKGLLARILRDGQPVLENENDSEDSNHRKVDKASSLLAVPLQRNKQIVGAIILGSARANVFEVEDRHFLSSVSNQIIAPLRNSILQAQVTTNRLHLSRLMETVNSGIWFLDSKLRLIAQNSVAAQITGWTPSQAIGRSISELLPRDRRGRPNRLYQRFEQVASKWQSISLEENFSFATTTGELIFIGGNITPVIQDETVTGAIFVFWQQSPEKIKNQLELEFANMASHLLRNPLNFIQSSIDLLLKSGFEFEDQQRILSDMRTQSLRLTDFTNELLKTLRAENEETPVRTKSVDPTIIIEQAFELVSYGDPRYTFELAVGDSLPQIIADPTKTELILLNLLLNATKRCPNGGHITIAAEVRESELIVSITDNGERIPQPILTHIFDKFYPVDIPHGKMPATYQLGLYTTKRLIELQNGHIWVNNAPKTGSQFCFSLPISKHTPNGSVVKTP